MSAVYPFIVREINRRVAPSSRVLDLGCGAMQYREHVRANYEGLDPGDSRWPARSAPDWPLAVEDASLPADSFDLIFAVASLGYVRDLSSALAKCRHALAPRGVFLVFDYERRVSQRHPNRPHHFDAGELRRALEDAAFSARDISSCSWGWGPFDLMKRFYARTAGAHGTWVVLEAKRNG